MTPDQLHDDSLDPVIRNRRYTGKPAVDALNSTVPQADDERRDALEQRLMARVLEGKAPGKNRPMIHNAALQGAYETPRRFRISTSMLLTTTVGMLFATVLIFSSFNRPPSEKSPWAVAPINRDQDATAVPVLTVTPTPLEATATPIPFEGQGIVPTTVPLTAVPHDPNSAMTATPVPFTGEIVEFPLTATPVPFGSLSEATTYTVQEGDTLIAVAEQFGVSIDTLIRLNNLDPRASLEAGRELVISFPETSGMPTDLSMATATPVPFNLNDCTATDSCDLIVLLPAARIDGQGDALAAGQHFNLFTTLAVPSEDLEDDTAVATVPVAVSVEILSVNGDGTATTRVSVEEGIVLNWLLNQTPAVISYELAE